MLSDGRCARTGLTLAFKSASGKEELERSLLRFRLANRFLGEAELVLSQRQHRIDASRSLCGDVAGQ